MVDCSGLENQRQESPGTAETADFCGSQDAQDALFTPRSAGDDGKKVGTRPAPTDIAILEEIERLTNG